MDESKSEKLFNYYSKSIFGQRNKDDQFIENESLARLRFAGSRISAPGINVESGYADLSYEPIVQVFVTNPNQIIYTDAPDQSSGENPGNILIDRGPPVISTKPMPPPVSYIYEAPESGNGVTTLR